MHTSLSQKLLQHLKTQQFVRPGDRVGVAVSGGADSVALLLLLLELRKKLGIVLSVVHFNHKLRGKASDADEKFVAKLAAKHQLEFHSASMDVAKKAKEERANLEETGRRARYDYFQSLAETRVCAPVAVAHTADDQAETVLAHLLRGTGLAGLGGIHPVAGNVVRPLLNFRRAELRSYLRTQKQSWREDATNRDTRRTRARIRRKLLPLLEKQFQPNIVEHLTTLAEFMREDEALLETLAEDKMARAVQKRDGGLGIAITDLCTDEAKETNAKSTEAWSRLKKNNCTRALSKRIVRGIVEGVKKQSGQLSGRHVDAVLKLVLDGENGSSLSLPGGVQVRKEHGELVFLAARKAIEEHAGRAPLEFEYNIDLAGDCTEVKVPELGCVFRLKVIDWPRRRGETNDGRSVLGRERLRPPLVLRNWHPGDRLRPVGHSNTQKLKRLLNEKHIGRRERTGWPVLTSGGVLAWVRGFPVAAEFVANESSRAAVAITEEPLVPSKEPVGTTERGSP